MITIQTKTSFLPEKLVMIDCEMTGLQLKSDIILQVAMLKLSLDSSNNYQIDSEFEGFMYTDRVPTSEFDKTYLKHIYQKCNNKNTSRSPEELRYEIKNFIGKDRGTLMPVGDCVPTDIEFLLHAGLIDRNYYRNDRPIVGTLHYEFFEMNSLKLVARHRLGYKFDANLSDIQEGKHDALVDCKNQLIELNAILNAILN